MKCRTLRSILALAVLSAAPCLHAACSNATLAGTFAFTTTGTLYLPNIGPVPVGAVGTITFDLEGNASGSQDRAVATGFAHESIKGTFTFSRDCRINLVANVYNEAGDLVRTSIILGVLADNGKLIRAIFASITANGVTLPSVLTVEGNRIQGHAQ
jgi:hypothetical protein